MNQDGCDSVCQVEALGSISGFKYYDKNKNGKWDGWKKSELKLNGWKIFVDTNENQKFDDGEKYDITGGSSLTSLGQYSLGNLTVGTYQVCEVKFWGWLSTLPDRSNCQTVMLDNGENKTDVNFGNFPSLKLRNRL